MLFRSIYGDDALFGSIMRLLLAGIAICLIYPRQPILHWSAFLTFIVFFVWDWLMARRQTSSA